MKEVRAAVIGAGYIASRFHIPILRDCKDVQLVAICDTNSLAAQSASMKFGIPHVYTSIDEMLAREDLNLVDVLTPPQTHASVCEKVLNSHVNCLVEKPLTTSLDDADNLIHLANQLGLKLCVIHNYSYVPAFIRARKIVDSGDIGMVLNVDGFYSMPHEDGFRRPDHWVHGLPGDVLGEVAPHFTMLVLDYLNAVKEVKATLVKRGTEPHIKYDEMKMILVAENAVGSITVLLGPGGETRRAYLNITGTQGSIYADGESQALVKYGTLSEGWSATERGKRALSDIAQRVTSLVSTTANTITGRYEMAKYGHRFLIESCVKSLLTGASYPVSLEKCREEVRILEQAFSQDRKVRS